MNIKRLVYNELQIRCQDIGGVVLYFELFSVR